MSFAGDARKVLDTSLPLNHRVNALKGCVRRYRPLGFSASFSFLESVAGDFAKDPAALPRALELLTTSYAAWQAELRVYGLMRRRAKQLGQRVPHPSEPNPNKPSYWYGARREAALHAVWFWYSKGASANVDVQALARTLLERGRFTAAQRAIFEEVHADLRARFVGVDSIRDLPVHYELRSLLAVMREMAVVAGSGC